MSSGSDWQPRVYDRFSGVLEGTPFGDLEYVGLERDWNRLGYTPEQNRALGHVFVVSTQKSDLLEREIAAQGDSKLEALDRLRITVESYHRGPPSKRSA